ncbi:cupin domain-containing protein [Sphingomonas qomolangmaensis]|uniref:Cupin domain-containing protein n=1 Tax=Sphingomonas qomolangmaensis TaxID=2918765 RepID=A0ABY5L8L7_9SPHN|nr:cupin domain-containing protein [Sphingomonas qomolangmaensis]UUL83127.1 cupin domain-containing protein [Sphingomonas qomolangmaensis]
MRRSTLGSTLVLASLAIAQLAAPAAAQTLAQRIGRTDPAKMRELRAVHEGAGKMQFQPLLGADAVRSNLVFVHRGVILPKSGIGQHYHHQGEEMFVILDGEAQFTIDGRTATLAGPAAVPDLLGHAHGIYNATDKPLQWLNINVGLAKAYDKFDLNDPLDNATLDRIPQFVSLRLDRALLKPVAAMDGGTGTVRYRRALEPTVFSTAWSFVDHLVVPPGASVGSAYIPGMSEVLYVVSGAGEVTVAGETAPITAGDAVPVNIGQARAIRATGAAPLELMVIGIAEDLATKADYVARQQRPR